MDAKSAAAACIIGTNLACRVAVGSKRRVSNHTARSAHSRPMAKPVNKLGGKASIFLRKGLWNGNRKKDGNKKERETSRREMERIHRRCAKERKGVSNQPKCSSHNRPLAKRSGGQN